MIAPLLVIGLVALGVAAVIAAAAAISKLQEAGKDADKNFSGCPVGSPSSSCAADSSPPPTSPANSCPDAPKKISLPKDVNEAMQKSYKNSYPDGKSQERGATLVNDSSGAVKVVNEGTGTAGTFSPNRSVPAGDTVIGTYHTHPYDASEGGYKDVSFSDADIYYAQYYKEPIYVQSGDSQFMIMPTKATPAMDQATVKNEWNDEFKKAQNAGQKFPEASRTAANAIAKKYNMAYYEGRNGTLTKVSC
jgi:hypothetical protein